MITKIQNKTRNFIEDNIKSTFQTEIVESGRTFTIEQENANAVTLVTVSGVLLDIADYSYEVASQTLTIAIGKVEETDVVIIYFTYYKYANSELLGFIKASLDFMSCFDYYPNFIVSSEDTDIYPIPNIAEQSLIARIASIIIKPNYSKKFPDIRESGKSVVEKIHIIQLRMLKIFNDICKRHDLDYFLIDGTLFEPPDGLFLQDVKSDNFPHFGMLFAKMRDKVSKTDSGKHYHPGVFLQYSFAEM